MSLDLDRLAIKELRKARRKYARVDARLASDFIDELFRALTEIEAHPLAAPLYLFGTRIYRLRRFPYLIIYDVMNSLIQVIAVAHVKRAPGYWRRRLKP